MNRKNGINELKVLALVTLLGPAIGLAQVNDGPASGMSMQELIISLENENFTKIELEMLSEILEKKMDEIEIAEPSLRSTAWTGGSQ